MIQSLKVKGLNKRLDGEFEFNEDLNIFTGPNGSGKTTLLKLIWYLISGNLHRIILEIPFRSVSIKTHEFFLSITIESISNRGNPKIDIQWEPGRRQRKYNTTVSQPYRNSVITNLNRQILKKQKTSEPQSSLFFSTFRRIEGGYSIGSKGNALTVDPALLRLLNSTTDMLQTAMSRLSEEVSTDRHKFITSVSTKDIENLLPKIKVEISEKKNKLYTESSHRISKVVNSSSELESNEEIAVSAITHIRDELIKTDAAREELDKKLGVLDFVIMSIFGRGIRITEGIYLGDQKNMIQSDKLSYGEKQMLSFLCYNAFYKDTAIFIDEPELSLHVDWQRRLFPTLLEQGQNNQFFVATHSPFIYTKYPDKEFLLDEDRGES